MTEPHAVDVSVGQPRWTADVTNLIVRHSSGFTVHHSFRRDGTCRCLVINGGPNLEDVPEAERKVRLAWLKHMLRESLDCLFEALRANLH